MLGYSGDPGNALSDHLTLVISSFFQAPGMYGDGYQEVAGRESGMLQFIAEDPSQVYSAEGILTVFQVMQQLPLRRAFLEAEKRGGHFHRNPAPEGLVQG